MENHSQDKATICVHAGTNNAHGTLGVNTPIYTSSAFNYMDADEAPYPRYYNTPNQKVVADKICALESGESGLLTSSGMAAVSMAVLSLLQPGDHIILQNDLYGGTYHFVEHELSRLHIEYTFVQKVNKNSLRAALKPNTRIVYIETPSNPLLKIVDIAEVASFAKEANLVSIIDNTFASPINQNPLTMGIDVVIHSGTKYLGGHSDLCFGAVVTSKLLREKMHQSAINLGGSVNATTCALIERSIKTLALRVKQQNENAQAVAEYLQRHPKVRTVNYPGLKQHPDYALATEQMRGYGGMLSFEPEVNGLQAAENIMRQFKIITPAVSLGGVESLVCSPTRTSHAKMSAEARREAGVQDELLRISIGIESADDLISDFEQALKSI